MPRRRRLLFGSELRAELLRRIATPLLVLILIVCAASWLSFQHIPRWYQPLWLTRAQAEAVRGEAERAFEFTTEKMLAGQPFSVTFTARQINEMLAAQQLLWPAATAWLDARLSAPCVEIGSHHLNIGMRCAWGQIQSVLSARLAARPASGGVALHLASTRAGSLPMPGSLFTTCYLRPRLEAPAAASLPAPETRDTLASILRKLLTEGQTIAFDQVMWWHNGDIPFSITDMTLREGSVTIHVSPES